MAVAVAVAAAVAIAVAVGVAVAVVVAVAVAVTVGVVAAAAAAADFSRYSGACSEHFWKFVGTFARCTRYMVGKCFKNIRKDYTTDAGYAKTPNATCKLPGAILGFPVHNEHVQDLDSARLKVAIKRNLYDRECASMPNKLPRVSKTFMAC